MLRDPTPRMAIEFAVKTEQAGGVFYRKMAKRLAGDTEIAAVFSKLAEEEDVHKKQFEVLLDTVPQEFAYKSQTERLAVLRATSMSEFFLGEDGIFKNLDEIETREDALHRALRLEKDTLAFYQAVKDLIGDNDILEAMIAAERNHVQEILERLGN